MKVTLKDGSIKEYSGAKTVYEIACDISEGLGRAACAGEVDGNNCTQEEIMALAAKYV